MAIPDYEVAPTLENNAEADASWSGWGSNSSKWDDEEDFVYQGTYSRGLAPSSTGDSGYGVDDVGGVDLSNAIVLIWVYVGASSFLSDSGNKSCYVRVTSGNSWTTNYKDWIVATSSTKWIGAGWHIVAVDLTKTEDVEVGTFVATSVDRIGIGLNVAKIARKSTVFAIDQIMYIDKTRGVEICSPYSSSASHSTDVSAKEISRATGSFTTDGFEVGDTIVLDGTTYSDGEYTVATVGTTTMTVSEDMGSSDESSVTSTVRAYLTFEDLYTYDYISGNTGEANGLITKNRDNQYELNYPMTVGDTSGSQPAYFRTRNEVLLFTDQLCDITINAEEDSGTTYFEIGNSDGTGDTRVGFGGTVFAKDDDYHGTVYNVSLTNSITKLYVFNATFLDLGTITFGANTSHLVTNTTFTSCGQVDLGSVEARNLIFTGYDASTDGALKWGTNINIKASSFLANTNSTGDAHGIEHETGGSVDYYGLKFSGNDYAVLFASSGPSSNLIINLDENCSAIDAGDVDDDNSTYDVSIISSLTITVTVKDINNNAIEGAQVYIQKSPPSIYTADTGNTAGDGDIVVNETVDTETPSEGWLRVWIKSLNKTQSYRYVSWSTKTFTFPTEVTYNCTGGGTGILLQDSVNNFTTLNIKEGDTVRNTTDGSWAIVDKITDASNITTTPLSGGSDNTWTSGDTYSFHKLAVTLTDNDDLIDIPILNDQTDSNGEVTKSYGGSNDDIFIRIRKDQGTTNYIPFKTVDYISTGNKDITCVLQEDTVAE